MASFSHWTCPEAERRRLEMEQRRREDAEQLKALEQEAAAWVRSQQLRAYIDALESEARRRGAWLSRGASSTDGWKGRGDTPTASIH